VLYTEGNNHHYYLGKFTYLLANVRAMAFQPYIGLLTTINFRQLAKRLLIINMDLLNVATICDRLIWQQALRVENRLNNELWRYYAQAIKATNTKRSSTSLRSFNELIGMVKNQNKRHLIETRYVTLALSCDWFEYIKKIRDSIEHYAAETVVDNDINNVQFNISALGDGLSDLPSRSLVNIPEITTNNSFLNFELFAGIYVGYLIWYLEELSSLIYHELKPNTIDEQSKNYHPGFDTTRTWIQCAAET
jgi:hypothetical protein